MKFHIVQKNESLWSIAKKYGVDFEQLKMANGQLSNPNVLMPGMKVKVPTDHVKEQPTHHKHEQMKKEQQKHPFVEQKEHKKEVQKPAPKPAPKPKSEAPTPQPTPKPPKKEQPKQIYHQPIMPYLPEIDINNYYTMNMSQMQQQLTQPQAPIQPPVQHESKVEPTEDHEVSEQPCIPQPYVQQPYCIQPQQPICDPCYPYQQPIYDPCYPYQQPMPYPMQQAPLPGMAQPFVQTNWHDESSHIGYMPTNQQQAFVPPQMPQYMPSPQIQQSPQYMSPQMPQYVQQPYYPMPNQPFYGYGMQQPQPMPAYRPFVNEEDDETEKNYE